MDKNSPSLHTEVRSFFIDQLGFGDFVFRRPDGGEIGRAANLRFLEQGIDSVSLNPDTVIDTWLFMADQKAS